MQLRSVLALSSALLASACAHKPNVPGDIFTNPVAAATSCSATGTRSCCCKDIGGNDCIKNSTGCTADYPIPILLP
jgi:hypothetical protein